MKECFKVFGWQVVQIPIRSDPYGVPPYTPPTNYSMINPVIMDLYSYYTGGTGANQRHQQTLNINGVNYMNPATNYYDLNTIKNDVIAANIPNYIGLFLDLHYGGTFVGGVNNLNGELILAVQLCGADKTNFGYCAYNTNTALIGTVANTLANNTVAQTTLLAGCNYNYSRLAWRNLMNSIGLPYISSHSL
jgi:hypothetical protein